MCKISVIIPVYNVEKYISNCLASICNQTLQEIEIICIDDCSIDDSCKIIDQYKEKDDRIFLLKNTENLGAALTRNKGLEVAKGEYIYFIDADDWIDNDYLFNMYEMMKKVDSDIILNLNIKIGHNDNETSYVHPTMQFVSAQNKYFSKEKMIHDSPCDIWARLYRTKYLRDNSLLFLNISTCNDLVFNTISHLFSPKKFFVFYGSAYHYISRDNSITGTVKKENNRDCFVLRAYSMIFDYLTEKKMLNIYSEIKLFHCWPFFEINSEDKFMEYKNFIDKIKETFYKNNKKYNDMEIFFVKSIDTSSSYSDYLKKYNKSIIMSFLKLKRR